MFFQSLSPIPSSLSPSWESKGWRCEPRARVASQDFRAWERLCKKNAQGNRAHFPQTTAGRGKLWPAEKVNPLKPWKTPLNGNPGSTATTAPCACVRACVGVCVRARRRTGRWEAASPPLGLPVSQRASGPPNGRGRRKMAAAANSGSSLPLFDCPTWWVAGRPALEWPGYAGLCRQGGWFLAASRTAQTSWDWVREKCPSGRAACGGARSSEPGPRNRGNPELGALRRWLRQPLGQSAGCRGASGPWSRTYPNSWLSASCLSAWCSCGARYLPPALCPERARASFLAPIPPQSLASRGCYCSLVRPLPVSRWLGAPWGQERLWRTPVLLATSAKSGTRGHPCLLGWTPNLPSQVLGNNGIILVFEWSTRWIIWIAWQGDPSELELFLLITVWCLCVFAVILNPSRARAA